MTNTADDGSPGTLRAIIATANSNDNITFVTNLSGQTITLNHTTVTVSNNLTIDASSLANGLIITISNQYQANLFVINSNIAVTLNGLTFLGPQSAVNNYIRGGAIYNEGNLTASNCTFAYFGVGDTGGAIYNAGTLTVNRSTFMQNFAFDPFAGTSWDGHTGHGGAIYNSGILTINESTFTNNFSDYGDGGGIFNAGILTVNKSTFLNNFSPDGEAGAVCNSSNMTINQCTFISNFAAYGGSIENYYPGMTTVNQSTFVGGSPAYFGEMSGYGNAYGGGGIENDVGTLTVNQSTFTGISVDGSGGAIENDYGTVTVNQSTITGNTASSAGGGIYSQLNNQIVIQPGSFTLFNSIVTGNTTTSNNAPNISCDVCTNTGVNLTNGIPLLAPIGNYGGTDPNHAATAGSHEYH